ncbi:MAG: hypothetical protein WCZ28_17860 [Burkholderiaceae bacterium]
MKTMSMDCHDQPGNPTTGHGVAAAPRLPDGAARTAHAHVLAAVADLERLLQLLEQAEGDLMRRFREFDRLAGEISREAAQAGVARKAGSLRDVLMGATTAMQFQDMSTQLVEHALAELRTLARRLADDGGPQERDGVPQRRRGPVSQDGMDAGSVELF